MKILKNENTKKTHKFICDTCGTQFIADFGEYKISVDYACIVQM